jgi:hypothetical protein
LGDKKKHIDAPRAARKPNNSPQSPPSLLSPNTAGPVLNKAAADDEDKKLMPAGVSLEGPLIRYGLTDWKLYVPLGLALSVPFLANEVKKKEGGPSVFVGFGRVVGGGATT